VSNRTRLVGACVVLIFGGAGCGGAAGDSPSSSTSTAGTALTIDQAQELAFMLFNNYQRKGAEFRIERQADEQTHLVMTGSINFRTSTGAMLLQARRGDQPLSRGRRIVWTPTSVLEGDIPGLQAAMAKRGKPKVEWVERPIAPAVNPVDSALVFLNRLASRRRDNPALIQQGNSRFLESRAVEGQRLSVYIFQRRLKVSVSEDGLLRQAEATLQGERDPVIVSLSGHGPKTIAPPPANTRVALADIRDLYRSLVQAAG
jgi:hypothetical protein